MSIEIIIDASIRNQAEKIAEERMKFGFRDNPNQKDYKYNQILIAVLGELALENHLITNGIIYERVGNENDVSGFDRYFETNDLKLETKTSPYHIQYNGLSLLYNLYEYNTKTTSNIDYVIQVFIEQKHRGNPFNIDECEKAQIVGGAVFSEIPTIATMFEDGSRGDCYRITQSNLISLDRFL